MKKVLRSVWLVLLVLFCAFLGFWTVKNIRRTTAAPAPVAALKPRAPRVAEPFKPEPAKVAQREESEDDDDDGDVTTVQAFSSCRQNEVILRFPSQATFLSFATAVRTSKLSLVARLDRLLAMRLAYRSQDDVGELLTQEHVTFSEAILPEPGRGAPTLTSEAGGEPVGAGLLAQLGITGDRSRWGEGVRIGILDSGVIAHPTLKHFNRSVAVAEFPKDLSQVNGHGTAIASLAAGSLPDAQGVAPAAEIVSIKVATEEGRSDPLFMATGILAAVDERVDLLNISMGQSSDNSLLADAVKIAQDAGVVIIASSGNDGVADSGYPADYPKVVSVGAVDAKGIHMGFSNFGKGLSITAPGCAVNAAWPGGRYVSISGTSASAPIVTGAIAAVMSNGRGPRVSAVDATAAVIACADDAGIPGSDTEYGAGILDVGRVMQRNTPGIIDGAVTDLRVVQASNSGWEVQVAVQNQGTTILANPQVEIRTPAGLERVSQPSILPQATALFTLPVYPANWQGKRFEISAVLQFANAAHDVKPANNMKAAVFTPP
jgi:hypothetical protein